ncbi:cobalt-zinc-cadmium resistance protein [Bacillus velezensis]|nr:cobalt-zinc-cadmium resistance protein [Bacillus velezensis]QEV90151.1 cobalt-zinc-cadmium resistance protein [Bacillus velezensis]
MTPPVFSPFIIFSRGPVMTDKSQKTNVHEKEVYISRYEETY